MKSTSYDLISNLVAAPVEQEDNGRRLRRLRRGLPLAMETLTPRQRQMVTLHYFHSRTVTDIARELQVNKSTVSRCLRRSELRLRQQLRMLL